MSVWGEQVVAGRYAGHNGKLFEPRPRSLVELLDESSRFDGREFLVQGDQRISFELFRRAVIPAAEVLRNCGVHSGDRVLMLAYNSPAWVLGFWACWVVGAVPVLGSRWWSDSELDAALEISATQVVITDRADLVSHPTVAVHSLDECFVDAPDTASFEFVSPPREDDEAMILFTSGSTGRAKGVRLSHRSVIANQHNLLFGSKRLPHQQDLKASPSVNLVSVPLFHIGGVSHLVTQIIAGGRLVFLRGRLMRVRCCN